MTHQAVTTTADHEGGRLTDDIGRLQVHDHLCLIYKTREEQFAAVVPFMRLGLERGEKCLYIADENTSAVVRAAMEAGGIDTAAALKSGALSVLSTRDAYLKDGYFDPDMMIRLLGEAIAAAKAEGFTALRATGEMTWALGNEIGVERLLEYESKLNSFFPENNIVAICQFNRHRFAPEVIREAILTHPMVIHGEKVCKNFYFVPPDEFCTTAKAARGVDRLLRNIREREAAEETLREHEEHLTQLMNTLCDGVVMVRLPNRLIEYVNRATTVIFGYSPEEMIGRPTQMFYADGAGYAPYTQRLQDALAQGRNQLTAELELRRKDGQTFWGEVRTTFLFREGQPSAVIGVIRDITERKRAAEERQAHLWFLQSMDRVNRVLQGTNDLEQMMNDVLDAILAIFDCDRAWLVYPADPDAASFSVPMECTRPEFPGGGSLKVEVPMDPDSAAVIRTVRASSGPVRFGPESVHPLPTEIAKRFSIQSQIAIVINPKVDKPSILGLHQCSYPRVWTPGEERLFQEIGRRLTDGLTSLLAHRELRKSENRYRRITEGLTDYQYSVRVESGRPVETIHSPACATMTGYTAEEFAADPYLWFRIVAPEDRELIQERVQHILAGEDIPPIEHRILRKDGAVRWVCDTTIMLKNGSGQLLSYDGVIEDITEKLVLEAQLRQAQKMESVGRLAGGVAHDFNNMLGVIIGYTELALEQVDPAQPLFPPLQEIHKAAVRSADLTRQLLAFARKQTVIPQVLDLNEIVEGMLKMLRRLIGEDIHLAWLPGTGVWPVKVDPSQIDQILANLCVNARDAITGTGKITIETHPVIFNEAFCADHPGAVPGEYVLLTMSDDGCGMNQETLGKLFEPFFTTKEMGKGTGLGLATVYGIVKQNLGFITVSSERGHGTTFRIYLPRHVTKTETMPEKSPVSSNARGHETILLVEDEPAILDMVRLMLEKLGYRVLATLTPSEAIRMVKKHAGEVHLLITDVIMPEMNGRDLANKLIALYPEIRYLFMSGYTSDVIAHHSVLNEGVHFMQKPFSMQALAAKVRVALDSNSV
ncbi:MAG: hypothetical protein ACD_75C02649G0004 [uncultured bacterium]|nr:MAG: hypothetical protein ACD_75C02649G0004 [uncultured bacterium]